ncbi:MAG: hypothetical protein AAF959_00500 [Cyanobacteria bacterium P01_D01_bin.56]
MGRIKDSFLRRLMHNYSRYILLTVIGSSTLLVSFNWTAETSLLSAAGLAVLLELLLSSRKAKPELNEKIKNYNP